VTRDQLEHAIRAVCDLIGDDAVYVFGSQAVLGEYPDAPAGLRQSMEVDVSPVNRLDKIDDINGVMGQDSLFHRTHGFYVDGIPITEVKLPSGWRDRANVVRGPSTRENRGICVEAHDLAASKLGAFRDKDREFVSLLLAEGLISSVVLLERLETLEIDEAWRERLKQWVTITADGLRGR
jgi:hypothetical protein